MKNWDIIFNLQWIIYYLNYSGPIFGHIFELSFFKYLKFTKKMISVLSLVKHRSTYYRKITFLHKKLKFGDYYLLSSSLLSFSEV